MRLSRIACLTLATLVSLLTLGIGSGAAWGQSQYAVALPELRGVSGQNIAPTEFPPASSELRFWACLVSVDPINRTGVLRWEDRDQMLEFEMLPYAPVFYRGAPAALGDIPPGTMVHAGGLGDARTNLPRNILRMSDAASVQAFDQIAFEVQSVDRGRKAFSAIAKPNFAQRKPVYAPQFTAGGNLQEAWDEKPVTFSYNDQTDWYVEDRIVSADHLEAGQQIRVNFIRKFYAGPR